MADQNLVRKAQQLKGVFVLGGDIVRAEDPNHLGLGWRSRRGLEADKTGPTLSYERGLAAVALWRWNNELILVPSAGDSNVEGQGGKCPATATVLSLEMQAEGVPAANIIEEKLAFTTTEHFIYGPLIARDQKWKPSEIGIVTTFSQFGRVAAMLHLMDQQTIYPFRLEENALISCERALIASDPDKWTVLFQQMHAHPEMLRTQVSEHNGTNQLFTGWSPNPKYPGPFAGFRDPLE
jgi:hypothetical protein